MKRAAVMLLVATGLLFGAGCDEIELEDVVLNLGGFGYGPAYYEPAPYYYEEVVVVEETYWYDDWWWW